MPKLRSWDRDGDEAGFWRNFVFDVGSLLPWKSQRGVKTGELCVYKCPFFGEFELPNGKQTPLNQKPAVGRY